MWVSTSKFILNSADFSYLISLISLNILWSKHCAEVHLFSGSDLYKFLIKLWIGFLCFSYVSSRHFFELMLVDFVISSSFFLISFPFFLSSSLSSELSKVVKVLLESYFNGLGGITCKLLNGFLSIGETVSMSSISLIILPTL